MQKEPKISFEYFLEKFPEIELPITFTDESAIEFSKNNNPLSVQMIHQFIDDQEDEFTEYIACMCIPKTHDFHAIIYWKAALMNYQYILATYDKKGKLIDQSVIAGTYSDGKSLTKLLLFIFALIKDAVKLANANSPSPIM